MSAWLIPERPLSAAARAFRWRWVERWGGLQPLRGGACPSEAHYTHLHAYPGFRCPLSFEEEIRASVEFHRASIARLAAGSPVEVLTFDYEVHGSDAVDLTPRLTDLNRDLWVSVIENPEDEDLEVEDPIVTHCYRTTMTIDDPRLSDLLVKAANGEVSFTVCAADLGWIAAPQEECIALHSFDPADLAGLEHVRRATWQSWGIEENRRPMIDLAQIASYFEGRRPHWENLGIAVTTEPEFRSRDGDRIRILPMLPADVSEVDWMLVGFASGSSSASVIVFDTGTCQVTVDPDVDNEDSEWIREYRQHAGSHDAEAVEATFERVVDALCSFRLSWESTGGVR